MPKAHGLLDLREELELVLDVVRRKHGTAIELAHVLGAVDDAQLAVGIDHAGITGVEVAVLVNHLGRGVRALVVLLEHRHALDQHLAVVGDLEFDAGCRLAHAVEVHLPVALQAHIGAGFGLAVELLEVDADGAVEAEQVRADGRARGVGHADAREPQHIAQRAIHRKVVPLVQQPVAAADRLAVQDVGAHAARQLHGLGVQPALEGGRVFHADGHRGQHALEHARRRKVVGRPDLAQVDRHGACRLGAVDGEARHQPLGHREQVVAHPGGGQVGNDVVSRHQAIDLDPALRRGDEGRVRLAHPLGLARGARGVQDDRHVLGAVAFHLGLPGAGVGAVPFGAQRHQLLGADEAGLLVVAQATWVVVNDVGDAGHRLAHLQQLVHLLLVLGEEELHLRVLDHEGHLGGHRVLVQRNGHATHALHSHHAHVQVRAVVADQGQVLPASEAQGQQAAGQLLHRLCSVFPGPGLPDTVLFFAYGRVCRALGCMFEQQLRERGLHSGSYRWVCSSPCGAASPEVASGTW